MGKTAGNAVWLDANKTSPFDFYQYWRNVDDADVMKCIRMLTFLPLEQIDEMATWKDAQLNTAKETLAYELTKMVHGEDEAGAAQEKARAIFGGGSTEHVPEAVISESDLVDGKSDIMSLLVLSGLCASRSDARRNIQQGGVLCGEEKVTDIAKAFDGEELRKGIVLRRGKKNFKRVILK